MPAEIHRQKINITNRFLLQEAPTDASCNVIPALCSPTLIFFQQSTMQSAYCFQACMFRVPPMNPGTPQNLPLDTSIRVKFNTGTVAGLVSGTQTDTATIHFDLDQKGVIVRKHHDFEIKCPTLQNNLPPSQLTPPLIAGLTNTTPHFPEFLVPEVLKPLVSYSHLLK